MPTRRLAAILFADIAGYTALMQRDELQAKDLLAKFRRVLTGQVAAAQGQIVHFYGDGCLATFDAPLEAVHCAMQIQEDFRDSPQIPVRVGLHMGTVTVEEELVYGDAVNLCSRIESLAVPGSVLLSKKLREELKNHPELQMRSLGKFALKNVTNPREIYALANPGLTVPNRKEVEARLKLAAPGLPRRWMLAILAGLSLLLLGLWGINQFPTSSPQEEAALNSIAVLPFTNMSPEEETRYFTDGMHDDLLTHLSKIGSLKVISRTSVNAYRNTQKTSPEIGKELGVATLLEGSVRRAGNTVRINVQLIKAETDEHLWSEIYDRELSTHSIFAIQTEIAKEIAAVLQTTISPREEQALLERPTESLAAYEAYLRGRQLLETRNSVSLREAKKLFEEAIALDSGFALAYVHLGETCYLLWYYGGENQDSASSQAWSYLNQGMALNDRLAEAYALKGYLLSSYNRDFEKAAQAFEKAIEINPNYAATYLWYGNAWSNLKRDFAKASVYKEKALNLNPISPVFLAAMAHAIAENSPQKAIELSRRLILLEPSFPSHQFIATIYKRQLGRLDSAAIISQEGFQRNKGQRKFLMWHNWALADLKMLPEMASLLEKFPLANRQDSLAFMQEQRFLALLMQDYEQALQWDRQYQQLAGGHLVENSRSFEILFFQKAFSEAARLYESYYPEMGHLQPLALGALDRFQRYIYCLAQSGQQKKADALWAKYGPVVLTSPGGKDETIRERQTREFFRIRHDVVQGRHEVALEKLAARFAGGNLDDWMYIEFDPMFDAVREHPRFQQTMSGVREKVAEQGELFRAYLAREK